MDKANINTNKIITILKKKQEEFIEKQNNRDCINPNKPCKHCETVKRIKQGEKNIGLINLASSFPCIDCRDFLIRRIK